MTEINSASKQRSRFWKIFAKLLMSNIPIAECLEIAGKSADEETKAVLPDIINEVKQGNKLHDILNNNKVVFTDLEIFVINPYTETDHLAHASNKLGNFLEEVGFPDSIEGEKNTRSKYWKTFGLLLESGVTLIKSMKVAAEWADEKIKTETDPILNEINSGSDFSTALEIRPDVFTKLELEMIRIGEWFGCLDVTIRELPNIVRMIEETDSETVKRQNFWKVLHSLSYPNLPLKDILKIALILADDKLKAISEDILKEIADKKTLSSIMQKHPDIFQEFETRMTALGEKNGNVWKTALDIAEIL